MSTTTLTPTSATADTPKLLKKAAVGETKGPTSPMHTTFGCQHIKTLLQAAREPAINGYTRLIQSLRQEDNASGRLYKSGDRVNATAETTYLCLQCPNVHSVREKHRKDHGFSVESEKGFIYCHECKDFVYDPTFEEVRSGNGKKRKHASLEKEGDKRLISTNSTPTPCAATGLRGLYNMGQTCFMSVILQSIIHNPLIRTYYLSELHKSGDCDRDACTSCALDDLFNDFFSQEKHEGYGAVHMLQGCWKGGGGLAGYSQQDAHEYLGFILNSLHAANTAEEDDSIATANKDNHAAVAAAGKDCNCVVHQTFSGMMQSTVTCTTCHNTTTTLDPFMDVSLDVRNAPASVKKPKIKLVNGSAATKETPPMDLTECLDRFTSDETLSSDSYYCRRCQSNKEATKKLSLTRLPPVLPVHLKRFSHSKTLATSSKVETKIRFPFSLDLTPYTTSSTSKSKNKNHTLPNNAPKSTSSEQLDLTYDLSSVIVHKGKIDNGHYISYSKQNEEWFRFDDSMVVQVDEKEVLAAEAYMLFYVAEELLPPVVEEVGEKSGEREKA